MDKWEVDKNLWPSTNNNQFYVYDSAYRFTVQKGTGNVGIGTTAPSSLLTVAGTSDLAWSAATSKLQISRSGAVARLQNYESGSASTNLALQWEGGNVGIGTTAPYGLTHWQKSSTVNLVATNTGADGQADTTVMSLIGQARGYSNNLSKLASIDFKTDPTTWYYGAITFNVANLDGTDTSRTPLEAMRINRLGNVGIGTTAPTNARLVISDTGSNKISIDGGSSQNGMRWEAVGGANTFYLFNGTYGTAGFGLYNVTTAATPLWIQNGGNVGIGTTTPDKKLEIFGSGSESGILVKNDTNTNYRGIYLGAIEGDNTAYGKLHMTPQSGELNITAGYSGWGGLITFDTNGAERMRIDSNGRVGIGTSSPATPLQVVSTAGDWTADIKNYSTDAYGLRIDLSGSTGTAYAQATYTATGTGFFVKNNSNVGIGISSPAAPLDVVSNSGSTGVNIRGRSSDNIGSVYFTSNASAATEYGFIQGRPTDLRIQGFNNGLILQPSGGNVGIGTSSPSQKLHVYESSTGSQAYVTVQNNRTRNAAVLTQTTNGGFYTGTSIGTDSLCWQVYDASAGERMRIDASGKTTLKNTLNLEGWATTGGESRDTAIYIGRDGTASSFEYFTMGFKTTARSGEQIHPASGPYNGGTALYIECGSTEAGGICLDQDSVHVYGSSDSGATFRVIDKDADVVTFEMLQSSWNGVFRGDVIAYGSMSSISDRRIKTDIKPIGSVLDKINKLGVYSYKKITAPHDREEIGVIAQEMQEQFPELVNEAEVSNPSEVNGLESILTVDYEHLTAVLLKGMQEQQQQINNLTKIIEDMKNGND